MRSANPHERTPADERARRFDEANWCWTRALRDGVLQVPGRPAIEVPDLAGSFDLIGFSYYFALTVVRRRHRRPIPPMPAVGPMGYAPGPKALGLVLRRLARRAARAVRCSIDEYGVRHRRRRVADVAAARLARAGRDGASTTASTSAGFFHWTGVDNYEWDFGYDVAFGLFDRDRVPKRAPSWPGPGPPAALTVEQGRRCSIDP